MVLSVTPVVGQLLVLEVVPKRSVVLKKYQQPLVAELKKCIDFCYFCNAVEVYVENKESFHSKHKCDSFYHYVS